MKSEKISKILKIIFLIYSLTLLIFTTTITKTIIMGDGQEYIGMTVSLFNHLSPDLRISDIEMIKKIENKNQIAYWAGYYLTSLNNKQYAVHFWMYSLFNLPVFSLLHRFNLNELKSFQITNSLLLILSLWSIIYFLPKNFSINRRIWFSLFAAINPVLFYIKWPHTEVFSYSFVIIAIVFSLRKDYKIAILASSIASLQNPPIIMLTLWLIINGWMNKGWKVKELIYLLIPFSVSFVSYLFYYWNYHVFSLLAVLYSNGHWAAASLDNVSIVSILSFFFDLNFGMLTYFPLLLLFSIFTIITSIKKKDLFVPSLWAVLFLMGFMASTTINLNHGMMYINRYAIWMIPLIILIVIYNLKYYEYKQSNIKLNIILLAMFMTTASITGILLRENDCCVYTRLNYVSKIVTIYTPNLYNPPYEIFTKRTTSTSMNYWSSGDFYRQYWPIIYIYDGRPRKILTDYENIDYFKKLNISIKAYNEIRNSGVGYINFGDYPFKWPIDENKISIYFCESKDKNNKCTKFAFQNITLKG